MQNLSKQFDQSKSMDDNAIKSGMEIRSQLKRLAESGNVELLNKLESIPEFKENENLYQGQANLAEMGQKGQEARKQLAENANEQKVDREVVLDVMVGEFANNVKMRMAMGKDVSVEMDYVGKQPNAERIMDNLKEEIGKTKAIDFLMEENGKDLNYMLGNKISSQELYKGAVKEVEVNQQNEKKAEELKKKKDMDMQQDANSLNNEEINKKKDGRQL